MTIGPSNDIAPIDQASPIPYYHQLATILRDELDRGRWEVDDLMPAEGELTEIFGVSRSVTRKALDLLEGEGRVLRIKGKGTVVTRPKSSFGATATAARWYQNASSRISLGRVIGADRVTAGTYLARLLDAAPGDDVWEIRLTEMNDDATHSLVESYLKIRGTLTMTAPPEFERGGEGFYSQLASKYGVEVTESHVEIEVVNASSLEARALGVSEGALLAQASSLDFSRHGVVGFTRVLTRLHDFYFSVSIKHLDETSRISKDDTTPRNAGAQQL